jgi:hypothetical protein
VKEKWGGPGDIMPPHLKRLIALPGRFFTQNGGSPALRNHPLSRGSNAFILGHAMIRTDPHFTESTVGESIS